jgi:hypothetical protein
VINQKVTDFDPQSEYKQDMAKMGYKQGENGQWHKQSKQAYSREADPEIAASYNPKAGVAEGSGKGGFHGDGASKIFMGQVAWRKRMQKRQTKPAASRHKIVCRKLPQ